MSALALESPFPIFTDVDGNPLNDGYIYVGTAGLNPETNPVQVYWDIALTVPAAQPVRTIGGYPSRSGSPARMYVNGTDYSMTVRNKNGTLIYSTLNQTTTNGTIAADLAALEVEVDLIQRDINTVDTAGAAPAYTLTPSPAITALAEDQRFHIKFHSATTGACTLAVNGLPATSLKQYNSAGAKIDPGISANQLTDIEYDGTDWVILDALPTSSGSSQIQQISASVGASALTISASALSLEFRSTTLGSGSVTSVSGTPSSLVISSGSTLGTTNNTQSDIAVLAINNAGVIEIAAVNIAGGVDLSETGLISTTAEGGAGAADSISTIYSTTARANVAYRVIGIIRSTQVNAGTWATAPSLIQGAGGQAEFRGTSMLRMNTDNGFGSTNTAIRRMSTTVTSIGDGITAADSATLGGTFTINTTGVYGISLTFGTTTAGQLSGISLNSTQLTTAYSGINVADQLCSVSSIGAGSISTAATTVQLKAGDVLRIHSSLSATASLPSNALLNITRLP